MEKSENFDFESYFKSGVELIIKNWPAMKVVLE